MSKERGGSDCALRMAAGMLSCICRRKSPACLRSQNQRFPNKRPCHHSQRVTRALAGMLVGPTDISSYKLVYAFGNRAKRTRNALHHISWALEYSDDCWPSP